MTRYCKALLNAATILLLGAATTSASPWSVTFRDSVSLNTSAVSVSELSGVTYVGPVSGGKHRFAAVQDGGGLVIAIEAEFDATANLVSAASVESLSLANTLDFEGIAYTGSTLNTAYISEENNPGVREYDLATGSLQEVLSIPAVFGSKRGNRGFESLARSADGSLMWTANEEALTVDGALSTPTIGSTVRLLQFEANGGSYDPSSQYAYVTEPIHGALAANRSGLTDLVVLPDGTVLALERSAAFASPLFLSSVFAIDFEDATDISASRYDAGLLADPNYTPVAKELLWSGAADGASGLNLEGLALGPRLANGNWVLLGVSDDSSSNSSTITTWELSATFDADFNSDGEVGATDFLTWQRGNGTAVGAAFSQGDADRDGDVDGDDLAIWESSYSTISSTVHTVPESSAWGLLLLGAIVWGSQRTLRVFP